MEKQKILHAEILLVEQQKLLLKEKQKLLEASQGAKILEDEKVSEHIVKDSVLSTVYENPTENDIKCLREGPKSSSEKKED